MRRPPARRLPLLALLLAALPLAGLPIGALAGARQGWAPPEPGPEHALLRELEGRWEATFRLGAFPGAPEVESVGIEVGRVLEGGLWLVSDYVDEDFPDGPFVGHFVLGWDPYEERYVGLWVDNQAASPSRMEGTYDAETRTLTMRATGRDPGTGAESTATALLQFPSEDERVYAMRGPGPGGEEMEYFSIAYRRLE